MDVRMGTLQLLHVMRFGPKRKHSAPLCAPIVGSGVSQAQFIGRDDDGGEMVFFQRGISSAL